VRCIEIIRNDNYRMNLYHGSGVNCLFKIIVDSISIGALFHSKNEPAAWYFNTPDVQMHFMVATASEKPRSSGGSARGKLIYETNFVLIK
jgi:hypothetical protein